ncbi:2'-5' RNA ligase family protein [Aerolutibacter daejeonensis]|uniref:2'-5' RNA ligase family protein n=1 Tax=Aerolutibacter daejeonensis TaxID=346181 RepID=UPI0018DC52B4|nr:2'-5' RNA ligase family protein [Lysobacter daejeonensis]
MSAAVAIAQARSESPDAATHTFANEDRDFPEWHGGIARYGFWAVVVDCPHWQALFDAATRHVVAHVLPGYRRQPHITIAAAGLLDEAHLSVALRQRQADAMRATGEGAFDLHAGPLDSFTGSPHVAIRDPSGALSRLRARLQAIARHDPPAAYRPHLTIGLYRDVFSLASVHHHLAAFRVPAVTPLRVREVSFCAYSTRELQGRFDILDTIPLENA